MPEDSVHQGIYIYVSCPPLPISGLSASLRLGAKLIKLFSTTKEFPKNLLLSIKKDYRIISSDNIGDLVPLYRCFGTDSHVAWSGASRHLGGDAPLGVFHGVTPLAVNHQQITMQIPFKIGTNAAKP